MAKAVQPGAPKESAIGFYILMTLLGIAFLALVVVMIFAAIG